MTGARRLAAWLYATAGLTYLFDRFTKLWAERALAGRPPVTVIPDVLQLNYTTNSGGAFGLGQSAPWVFVAATILVAGAISGVSIYKLGQAANLFAKRYELIAYLPDANGLKEGGSVMVAGSFTSARAANSFCWISPRKQSGA